MVINIPVFGLAVRRPVPKTAILHVHADGFGALAQRFGTPAQDPCACTWDKRVENEKRKMPWRPTGTPGGL
jgi:hypothetical protein